VRPIVFKAEDHDGRPVTGAIVSWTVSGTNGRLDQPPAATDSKGQFSVVWVLGTLASEDQRLTAQVAVGRHSAVATVAAVAKPVEVSSISFADDTTTVKLGLGAPTTVQATDPFGNHFFPSVMRFVSLDTTLLTVDSVGVVQGRKRGWGRVVGLAGSVADTTWVHVTQIVQAIFTSPDTLRFHSLGQTATLNVQLVDDQGRYVRDSLPADSMLADTVVRVQPGRPYAVRSLSNGVTPLILRVGVVAQTVQVLVNQRVASVKLSVSRTTFDALGDAVQLTAQVSDSLGAPLVGEALAYSSADSRVAEVGFNGLMTSRGNGSSWVYGRALNGVADSLQVTVAQQVARVVVKRDSMLLEALQAVLPVQAAAVDRLGAPVTGASFAYGTANASVATVDASGNIRANGNGTTVVSAAYDRDTGLVVVRVAQRPVRVVVPSDTVRIVALGETHAVVGIAVDSLGSRVAGSMAGLTVGDTAVVAMMDSTTVRSKGNGVTDVRFTVGSQPGHVTMVVQQVPETVLAVLQYPESIVTLPADTLLPLSCAVQDRNGFAIANASPSVTTSRGTVVGATCTSLRIQRSGFDTLSVRIASHATAVPMLLAVRPVASSLTGEFLQMDSLPAGTFPWAPTARVNDQGVTEVYFTAYSSAPSVPEHILGNLHRLASRDGVHFAYDGLALTRDSIQCSLSGSGIENVAIVPRSDSSGWRMFYAAGSFGCYGWQVFSAVSSDGRSWTREPGIRLSNGGSIPPQAPATAPYPVGEGMEVDRLPSGEFRMIVGTFEHVQPAPNNLWQIVEWRSNDQINWRYVGTVLTTRDMPPPGQGSVYSPTITQIAPGLWRMIFTADARGSSGSRSALWTAVSTDRASWQVEGQLMGAAFSDLYYSTLAGSRLFFIRKDGGTASRLAVATLQMP